MSDLNERELSAFVAAFEPLSAGLGNALSENINQMAMFDPPIVNQVPIDAVMATGVPVLQTSYSFPALSADIGIVVFSEEDARFLADLIAGGSGANPPASLLDDQMNLLTAMMSGFINGLGLALGTTLNRDIAPGPCATALEPISLPPSFPVGSSAVQIELPYQVIGIYQGVLRIYWTPAMARAFAPTAPAGGSGLVDSDEINALFGQLNAEAPAAMPTSMSAASSASSASDPGPFPSLGGSHGGSEAIPRGMELIMDIPLDVTVELGRVQMLIKDVLGLAAGSIIELERVAGEPVDLLVNGRLVAKGEVVVIDDNFGIRITEIISPGDRLAGVGK